MVRYASAMLLVLLVGCQVTRPAGGETQAELGANACAPVASADGPDRPDGCGFSLASGVNLTLKKRSLAIEADGTSRLYFTLQNQKDTPFLLAMRTNDVTVTDDQGNQLAAVLHTAEITDSSPFLQSVPGKQEYMFSVRINGHPEPTTDAWLIAFGAVSRAENLRWLYRIYE
jgi:hypothetical protein